MQSKDTISKNLLSLLRESIILKKLHIDGTELYANYKGWEKFHWKNGLVRLNIEHNSLLKWWTMNTFWGNVQPREGKVFMSKMDFGSS